LEFNCEEDQLFKDRLEKFAVEKGFLTNEHVYDLEDPSFAKQRWHITNGNLQNGKLKPHFYSGKDLEVFGGSLICELDTQNIVWRSYFKSSLTGYNKSEDNWFVVYSPVSRYGWITNIFEVGKCIFFTPHMEPGFFCYCNENEELRYFVSYKDEELPCSSTISFDGEKIIINQDYEASENNTEYDRIWRKLEIPVSEFGFLSVNPVRKKD
jgi:hypothetical protein